MTLSSLLFPAIAAVALAILACAHWFLYFSMTRLFHIAKRRWKIAVALCLIALTASYFASSALAHWRENAWTLGAYYASGIWLGVFTNLLMAFGLAWIAVGVMKLAKKPLDRKVVGIVAIALAILFSGYGVWNAYHPRVTRVTIDIKNLPAAWKDKTAVQIADAHLGHVFGSAFMTDVVATVNGLRPDIVFITGDLFDAMDGDLASRGAPLRALTAPLGTFFVTGNHETYLGVAQAEAALKGTGVKILNDALVNIDGLQILGISYPERLETKDVAGVIAKSGRDPSQPTILLYHSPTHVEDARAAGIDVQLSGHTHEGQIFPFRLFTYLIYHGLDYGLHRMGDFTLYTSSGVGAWGPTMRTGSRPEIVLITFE